MAHKTLMIQLYFAIFQRASGGYIKRLSTHPSDRDELVEARKMHLMCSAWDVAGNLLLAGAGGAGTGTVAWAPCADRTSVVAGIDQTAMSCLRGIGENGKCKKRTFPVHAYLRLLSARRMGKSTNV